MGNQNVISFDNLRQADTKIVGVTQTQKVKAVQPMAEHLSQPNCEGMLYQPKDLKDITERAIQSGNSFREMFQ